MKRMDSFMKIETLFFLEMDTNKLTGFPEGWIMINGERFFFEIVYGEATFYNERHDRVHKYENEVSLWIELVNNSDGSSFRQMCQDYVMHKKLSEWVSCVGTNVESVSAKMGHIVMKLSNGMVINLDKY